MASPAAPPQQPDPQQPAPQPQETAVLGDQLAEAINNGTRLAGLTDNSEDYLRFAQGVQTLALAFVGLHQAEHGPPTPPPPPPGGNPSGGNPEPPPNGQA